MSKAGLTALLTLLFLASGALTKTYAAEKLTLLEKDFKSGSICDTPLQNYLISSGEKCKLKIVTQKEFVHKFLPKNSTSYIYSTEPTYFKPQPSTHTPPQDISPTTPVSNLGADGNNNNSDIIFNLINEHRSKIGKPAFQKDEKLCKLAETRSYELHDELFITGGLHSGLYNRNLPYWITEDAKYGSNEAGTVDWWLHSPIHRKAIEGDYIYSCGACNGTQCSQLFTSYTPKHLATPTPTQAQEKN